MWEQEVPRREDCVITRSHNGVLGMKNNTTDAQALVFGIKIKGTKVLGQPILLKLLGLKIIKYLSSSNQCLPTVFF